MKRRHAADAQGHGGKSKTHTARGVTRILSPLDALFDLRNAPKSGHTGNDRALLSLIAGLRQLAAGRIN